MRYQSKYPLRRPPRMFPALFLASLVFFTPLSNIDLISRVYNVAIYVCVCERPFHPLSGTMKETIVYESISVPFAEWNSIRARLYRQGYYSARCTRIPRIRQTRVSQSHVRTDKQELCAIVSYCVRNHRELFSRNWKNTSMNIRNSTFRTRSLGICMRV